MLQIQNLTIIHCKDLRTIVKDLFISVNDGDNLAIIGVEGLIEVLGRVGIRDLIFDLANKSSSVGEMRLLF